jgi:crotonobetainyl-CoA:carnitine CoA-transferase CaiB-like acyl-CoA transferase
VDVLEGIQVIDLTYGVAGPTVGMFLADFGAEVIKVEPPAGDPARPDPGFAAWNRGKKSTVIDPADEGKRGWLTELLAGADVCLVSADSTLTGYGLDRWRIMRGNPRLVLVEIPPYAGPAPWHGGQESHGLLAAALGVARRQSSHDGGPVELVARFLLQVHGVWAAVCAAAALVEREKSGFGQFVCVTGANAVMEASIGSLSVDPAQLDPPTTVGPGGRHPTYTRFVAKDGKWLASGALGPKFETLLLGALGLSWMLEEERMGGKIQNLIQPGNVTWALEHISAAFLTRPRDEWLEVISALGIPCGVLASRDEWLDHAQVRAVGMRVEVDDPERGAVVMPGIPINLTGSPGRVRGPAPALGRDDRTLSARSVEAPPDGIPPVAAGPLAGFRVLDMGTFVAGPYAGALLAELGADVIKVEPLAGDPFRDSGFVYNRGMRSLAIDLQSPAGVTAFRRLAETSDVVVDAMRPGVTAKLGVDHDTLAAVHPGIITVSLSAYGEGDGPLTGRPGVDMVVQGMSGMMSAQGGNSEPVATTIPIIDVTTAAMLALAATLALLHRERTGSGQRAWASLIGTAAYLQTGELVRYDGRPEAGRGGRDYQGALPFDRFYKTSDGWVRIQAVDGAGITLGRLAAAGIETDPATFAADPAAALSAALAPHTSEDAAEKLNFARIAAVPARRVSSVIRDPRLVLSEFTHVRPGSDGSPFVTSGRLAAFSRTVRSGPMASPGVGEQSRDVLRDAGLTDPEIDELISSGVVVSGDPMPQALPAAYR